MPLPITNVADLDGFEWGVSSLEARPRHALLIMQCIQAISEADNLKGLILACIARADELVSMTLFQRLYANNQKDDALRAVARALGNEEQLKVVNALIEKTKSAFRTRNDFAHSSWGHSNKKPDIVIRVPVGIYTTQLGSETSGYGYILAGLGANSLAEVWTLGDLTTALERSMNARRLYQTYQSYLSWQRSDPAIDQQEQPHPTAAAEMQRSITEEIRSRYTILYSELKSELGM